VLAAYPLGVSVAAIGFGRWVAPDIRLRLMGPLAVVACAVLMLCAVRPGLTASLAIFAVSGAASCYQLAANVAFVTRVPDALRGRAYGLAQAGLSIGQGLAILLAGAAAERWSPTLVVATAGALGTAVALPLAGAWHRRAAS
jgi:hypothetical protein